jgi:hypothetical protein
VKDEEYCFYSDVAPAQILEKLMQDELNYSIVHNPEAKEYLDVNINCILTEIRQERE